MLVAMMNQKLFTLKSSISREDLLLLRKRHEFTCPQCGEQILLKVGQKKIPHFAHLPQSQCINLFSERESQNHLYGKQLLYDFFRYSAIQVELEPYIKSLAQRPDILVMYKDLRYAIEFQCSPIDVATYLKRTNHYINYGIQPIWILNTPVEKIRESKSFYRISLTQFEKQFITESRFLPYLFTFNPQTSSFYYFSHLLYLQQNQFLTRASHIPLLQQKFPFYLPNQLSFEEYCQLFAHYKNEQKQLIQTRLKTSRLGVNDILLRSFYELRLSLEKYPDFIGVPTPGSIYFPSNAVEWQSALFYFCQKFNLSIAMLNRGDFQRFLRLLKLEVDHQKIKALEDYCAFLRGLSIENVKSSIEPYKIIRDVYSQQLQYG